MRSHRTLTEASSDMTGVNTTADTTSNGISANQADDFGKHIPDNNKPEAEKTSDKPNDEGNIVSGAVETGAKVVNHIDQHLVDPATKAIIDPGALIADLKPKDQLQLQVTLEGKVQAPIPTPIGPVGIGNKSQYGYHITVERLEATPGETGQYEVTFNKHLQTGVTLEPPVPGFDPAAEYSIRTANSVTMRFDTQAEATRAVQALQRLAVSETLKDAKAAGSLATGSDPSLSNPTTNPVLDQGSQNFPLADRVAPSEQDMQFLQQNITSITHRFGDQTRLKAAFKGFNFGFEPRFDRNRGFTRTITMPQGDNPGRVTYGFSTELDPSVKESLVVIGKQKFDQLEVGAVYQNIADVGQLTNNIEVSWDLPASSFDSTASGTPVPELRAIIDGEMLRAPDNISGSYTLEAPTLASLADPVSRTDLRRFDINFSLDNPGQHAGPVLKEIFQGDIEGVFREVGEDGQVTITNETIRRDGFHIQPELKAEFADVAEGKISTIIQVGHDRMLTHNSRTFTANDFADRIWGPEGPQDPTVSGDQDTKPSNTYVVVPEVGLNVRETPSLQGTNTGDLQHGSFVTTGVSVVDEQGRQWVHIQSLDENDKLISGWVASEYLRPHNEQGAMDDHGRMNPELKEQGYTEVEVEHRDNLWDLAQQHSVDFQQMVELNQDHLINPGLIFPGDKVYIPGTAAPVQPVQEETINETQDSRSESAAESTESSEAQNESAQSSESQGESTESSQSQSETTESSESQGDNSASTSNNTESDQSASGQDVKEPEKTESPADENYDDPSLSGDHQTTTPEQPKDIPGTLPGLPLDQRPNLVDVAATYQVTDDIMVNWGPNGDPLSWAIRQFSGERQMTTTEADMMDNLSLRGQMAMYDIKETAANTALDTYPAPQERRADFAPGAQGDRQFSSWSRNDGHQDAFRHAYWNALMTQRFGDDFATRFATAHEMVPGNPQLRETMDLFNNEVGRNIALANPEASSEELAQLIQEAGQRGELLVIDQNGQLAWSDQIAYGQHGTAR